MIKKQLIEKYELENKNILNRRPDLNMNGDFTPDGIKVFCNTEFIADIKALNIPVVSNQRELLKFMEWIIEQKPRYNWMDATTVVENYIEDKLL